MPPRNAYVELARDSEAIEVLRPDFGANLERVRHRWFQYKEGFDSAVVDYVIDASQGDVRHLLDPFGGSGTTAVQAGIRGWHSTSIETNPFVAFVARTKALSGNSAQLRRAAAEVANHRPKKISFRLPRDTTLVQRAGLDKWLFNRSVVRRYEVLRSAIAEICDEPRASFLTLALVGAMADVANAKRDGKCWRYKTAWHLRSYGLSDLDAAFRKRADMIADDLEHMPTLAASARILQGDSRNKTTWRTLERVEHCALITSPPYLNSFDYTDIYRPEMLLLGIGKNSSELRRLRFETLRSHVQVDWPRGRDSLVPSVQRYVRRLKKRDLWNPKLAEMVNAYFVDLEEVFAQAVAHLLSESPVAVVVADSAYDGVVIPVPEIIAEILGSAGVEELTVSSLRATRGNAHHQLRGGRRMRECLVFGRKS